MPRQMRCCLASQTVDAREIRQMLGSISAVSRRTARIEASTMRFAMITRVHGRHIVRISCFFRFALMNSYLSRNPRSLFLDMFLLPSKMP